MERGYDRLARVYDLLQVPMELMGGARRRSRILRRARGRVLEVGVGTGMNFEHYPEDISLTGIDISQAMLARARDRLKDTHLEVRLEHADVENLPYPDASFDTVTATCVFCSVADPVRGLREVRRMLRPHGEALLLEHVRPRNPAFGKLFDLLTPVTRRLVGPEINRRTEENVVAAGLRIREVRAAGVWREIVAARG